MRLKNNLNMSQQIIELGRKACKEAATPPNPEYAASLIRTIELLRLYKLDQKVITEMKLKRP